MKFICCLIALLLQLTDAQLTSPKFNLMRQELTTTATTSNPNAPFGARQDSTPETRQDSTPETRQGSTPEVRQGSTPEVRQGSTPEVRQGSTPEARQDSTPEAKQDSTPEAKQDGLTASNAPEPGEEAEGDGKDTEQQEEVKEVTEVECVPQQKCYTKEDCGKGFCNGLAVGKCRCLLCPTFVACKSDRECGGLIGACNATKGFCDCDQGARANNYDNYFAMVLTVCNFDCKSRAECFGLECGEGTCSCP